MDAIECITELDTSHLVTEDDECLDNILSEKQKRLLIEPLYTSWKTERPFLAAANVGVFSALNRPPIVPDVFLSMDVEIGNDWWAQENRSYFLWEHGKAPEVAIEIVSNKKGGEFDKKWKEYARMGVPHYFVYDPGEHIQNEVLVYYELRGGVYREGKMGPINGLGLQLALWEGEFEGNDDRWLRWADLDGIVIQTGAERANEEAVRANEEAARAERLAAKLRELGVDPDSLAN